MNALTKIMNAIPMLLVSTDWGVTTAPVLKVLKGMADCVTTSMSVQIPTPALLPLPASTLVVHITATVAVASSLISPSAMT